MLGLKLKEPLPVRPVRSLAELAAEQGVLAPRRPEGEAYMKQRVKNPAVVLRTDGRFGVARTARIVDRPADQCGSSEASQLFYTDEWRVPMRVKSDRDRRLGRTKFNTTNTSGYTHEDTTYAKREDAEKRAWALAREIGDISDWP